MVHRLQLIHINYAQQILGFNKLLHQRINIKEIRKKLDYMTQGEMNKLSQLRDTTGFHQTEGLLAKLSNMNYLAIQLSGSR